MTIHLPSVLEGALSVSVGFDPLRATRVSRRARATAVLIDVAVTASTVVPIVTASLALALDLEKAIGLVAHPALQLRVAATNPPLSLAFQPLGSAVSADVSVAFLPAFVTTLTDAGKLQLVEELGVRPGVHAIVMALGTALDQPLWTGGLSLKSLLVGGGLLDATGKVTRPLPQPVDLVSGMAAALATHLHLVLAPTLRLGFGDPSGLGPQLFGHLPFALSGAELRLLLGDPVDVPSPRPLALDILRQDTGRWKLEPRLRVNRTGVAVFGPDGQDLVKSDFVRFAGIAAYLGFVVDVDLSGAAPLFSVGQWAAGAALSQISIPILSGGGGDSNPIASGLLSGSGGDAAQPQFDLQVEWDGQVHLIVRGARPGEPVWFPIDRAFGPLYIARIGVQSGSGLFANETLDYVGLIVDASIAMAGLQVAAHGLTVRVPPKYPTRPERWVFDLDGLDISYQNSSVTIVGGMLKQGSGNQTQYLGMLQVTVAGRGISALGAYGRTSDGQASLFAFVVINAPIGGPPYLFITGLAGGFGYNRRLLVPSAPEKVPQFPLMTALAGRLAGDPKTKVGAVSVLEDMAKSIPPERGAIWLAAGVKFTTFALLETNAILYAQFGNGFEIGLLGLMTARLPSANFTIASVELAMLARYSTVDNTLAVRAQLTQNSWLFTEDCRLTGGFAFMVWFDRPQALVTLGGYHNDFPAPAYYPNVPRVGFRWSPVAGVSIKGEGYFAITPEAAMAGGRLEARAEVNGIGYGEFVLYLDALLWFEPPRFVLDFGLKVGGQAFGFSFSIGARVHIELPPVYVLVHVDFMWGFDIPIGKPRVPSYLDFSSFSAKFLGVADGVCGLAIRSAPASGGAPPDDSAGHSATQPLRVAADFEVVTSTKFPAVSARKGTVAVGGAAVQMGSYHLVPMGTGSPAYAPVHQVSVFRAGDGADVTTRLGATLETAGVPIAVYWDTARGTVPAQEHMQVDYGDMPRMVSGVVLRADSQPTGSLAAISISDLVDPLPVLALPAAVDLPLAPASPLAVPPIVARPRALATATRVAAGALASASRSRIPVPPRLRWERPAASASTLDKPGGNAEHGACGGGATARHHVRPLGRPARSRRFPCSECDGACHTVRRRRSDAGATRNLRERAHHASGWHAATVVGASLRLASASRPALDGARIRRGGPPAGQLHRGAWGRQPASRCGGRGVAAGSAGAARRRTTGHTGLATTYARTSAGAVGVRHRHLQRAAGPPGALRCAAGPGRGHPPVRTVACIRHIGYRVPHLHPQRGDPARCFGRGEPGCARQRAGGLRAGPPDTGGAHRPDGARRPRASGLPGVRCGRWRDQPHGVGRAAGGRGRSTGLVVRGHGGQRRHTAANRDPVAYRSASGAGGRGGSATRCGGSRVQSDPGPLHSPGGPACLIPERCACMTRCCPRSRRATIASRWQLRTPAPEPVSVPNAGSTSKPRVFGSKKPTWCRCSRWPERGAISWASCHGSRYGAEPCRGSAVALCRTRLLHGWRCCLPAAPRPCSAPDRWRRW